MRSALLALLALPILAAHGMTGFFVGPALAQSSARPSAIDIDPNSPTLGEVLETEERTRQQRREPRPKAAPPSPRHSTPEPLTTGSILPDSGIGRGKTTSEVPHIPRDAATVILPRGGAGQDTRMVRQVYPPLGAR